MQFSKTHENLPPRLENASRNQYRRYGSKHSDRRFITSVIYYYAATSTNGIMVGLVAKGKKKTTKNTK
jgi:hypothetical protein